MEKNLIISLDGGGIFGAVALKFLDRLWSDIPWDRVCLVSGTSIGGVIAMGIGRGMNTNLVINRFQSDAERIFTRSYGRAILSTVGLVAEYTQGNASQVFSELFEEDTISSLQIPVFVPVFDAVNWRGEYITKSSQPEGLTTCRQAALAGIAAPTVFPAYEGKWMDGGIVLNNPSIAAACYASDVLGLDIDSVKVLSLGCGFGVKTGLPKADLGLIYWVQRVNDLFLGGGVRTTEAVADSLFGENHLRINPVLPTELCGSLSATELIPGLFDWADTFDLSDARRWLRV